MKILAIRALRGPSIHHNKPCILMRLDLEDMEQRPSDTLDRFRDRIEALLPSLHEHRCSVGEPGGFLQRVSEGTWMGHIIEHVALELQCLAAMEVGYGKTRSTATPGVYSVVYRYIEERSGLYAGEKAFELVQHLIDEVRDQVVAPLQDVFDLGPGLVDVLLRLDEPVIAPNANAAGHDHE